MKRSKLSRALFGGALALAASTCLQNDSSSVFSSDERSLDNGDVAVLGSDSNLRARSDRAAQAHAKVDAASAEDAEPSKYVLLAAGLAGIATVRRHRYGDRSQFLRSVDGRRSPHGARRPVNPA